MLSVTDQEEIAVFMEAIFGIGKINRYSCEKCGEGNDDYRYFDGHHITYKPCYVVKLCHRCHVRITHLNRSRARDLCRKLNNKDRWQVWGNFLKEDTSDSDYEESTYKMKDWFK